MEGPDLAMLPELDLGPAQCGGSGGRRGRLAGQGGYLALQLGEDQILVEGGGWVNIVQLLGLGEVPHRHGASGRHRHPPVRQQPHDLRRPEHRDGAPRW